MIGDTNCSVNFSPDAVFDFTESEEGDQLYFAEYKVHSTLPLEEAQEVMGTYLNRLRKPFNALYNTGVDLCQTWDKDDTSIKMVDYWQDEDNLDWKVKGYTDGEFIAVLYVKNINEITVEKQDEFLDSFCMGK